MTSSDSGSKGSGKQNQRKARRLSRSQWHLPLGAVCALFIAIVPAIALADEAPSPVALLPLGALEEARESQQSFEAQLTNGDVAAELPHHNLGRSEALELLEGVFEPELESPAGVFDNLDVTKFLSDQAAIVSAPEQGSPSGVSIGADSPGTPEGAPVLLESTLPLRTEGPDGAEEVVDLGLENAEGQLQPTTPLVEVGIPQELGEGIELPESGVQIELVGAPAQRSPSVINGSVAGYPNVATDTDFAVAPTPTGVETLTTLRSADSPRTETFRLDLPPGATLREGENGAEVVRGEKTILGVRRATAIDANGASVPVSMSVSGDSLVVTAAPEADTAWPVLVDPIYDSYAWYGSGGTAGSNAWSSATTTSFLAPEAGGFGVMHGLFIGNAAAHYNTGDQANWFYNVPRLKEEEAQGHLPTSYIIRMTLQNFTFSTSSGSQYPYLLTGIWDASAGSWDGVWGYPGNGGPLSNATLAFENGQPGARDKLAKSGLGIGFYVGEPTTLGVSRTAYLGGAGLEVGDDDTPTVANASAATTWANATATGSITVSAADTGLGVKSVTFELPKLAGGSTSTTLTNPCVGTAPSPCPRNWSPALPQASYDPSSMPQGL